MDQLETKRNGDLVILAENINIEHEKCTIALRQGLRHAVQAGELLLQAKSKIKHGDWLSWLSKNCDFSERTAQAYMRVAKHWPELEKTQQVADLTFRDAVKLLSGPKNGSGKVTLDDWVLVHDEAMKEVNAMLKELDERLNQAQTIEQLFDIQDTAAALQNELAESNFRIKRKLGEILVLGRVFNGDGRLEVFE